MVDYKALLNKPPMTEKVLDAFCEYMEGECYFSSDELQDFIQSLRHHAPQQEERR